MDFLLAMGNQFAAASLSCLPPCLKLLVLMLSSPPHFLAKRFASCSLAHCACVVVVSVGVYAGGWGWNESMRVQM